MNEPTAWERFDIQMRQELEQRNLIAAQEEQKRQNRFVPTKQPTLRCCYNCKCCVSDEDVHVCVHPLHDEELLEPTDMCAYIVIRRD